MSDKEKSFKDTIKDTKDKEEEKKSLFKSDDKVEKKSKSSTSGMNIDEFFANSRDAKKRGSYLEIGFRVWFQKQGKNKGFRQDESAWLKDLDNYAKAKPIK